MNSNHTIKRENLFETDNNNNNGRTFFVLGIDPGLDNLGWCFIQATTNGSKVYVKLIDSGVDNIFEHAPSNFSNCVDHWANEKIERLNVVAYICVETGGPISKLFIPAFREALRVKQIQVPVCTCTATEAREGLGILDPGKGRLQTKHLTRKCLSEQLSTEDYAKLDGHHFDDADAIAVAMKFIGEASWLSEPNLTLGSFRLGVANLSKKLPKVEEDYFPTNFQFPSSSEKKRKANGSSPSSKKSRSLKFDSNTFELSKSNNMIDDAVMKELNACPPVILTSLTTNQNPTGEKLASLLNNKNMLKYDETIDNSYVKTCSASITTRNYMMICFKSQSTEYKLIIEGFSDTVNANARKHYAIIAELNIRLVYHLVCLLLEKTQDNHAKVIAYHKLKENRMTFETA